MLAPKFKNLKNYILGSLLLIVLSVRYYPGKLGKSLKESGQYFLAFVIYGLAFAFLFKWFLKKFLRRDLSWETFFRLALWAAVVMALGESLRLYFAPY